MGKRLDEKEEFYEHLKDILSNEKVLRMKKFNQHSNSSTFKHSMHVAYFNYKICKKLGLDERAAARGGMLHDLFLYDWHEYAKMTGEHFHGLTHPKRSYINAKREFELSDVEKDIIVKHMWPITIALPKHKETWVIVFTDKYMSICEFIDNLVKRGKAS
ncbi:MAG: HDIG domain-containing protein [Lachnospiraceae bacterium]|nr:HDIG domain-containing protein [Lachnospiraceae bacterium]